MSSTPAQTKLKVDNMLKGLRHGKEIHDQFAEAIQTRVIIGGKTMEQWRSYFHVKIPENPSIVDCKELSMKLADLYQTAAHQKGMAEGILITAKKGYDSQYRKQFESTVSEYKQTDKKLPAKDTLETLAKHGVDDLETSIAFGELYVRFWKEIIEKLNFLRKTVETTSINNSVEAKILAEKY